MWVISRPIRNYPNFTTKRSLEIYGSQICSSVSVLRFVFLQQFIGIVSMHLLGRVTCTGPEPIGEDALRDHGVLEHDEDCGMDTGAELL